MLLRQLQQQAGLFDDAALEAIANKGMLRRARKDLQQNSPEILTLTETVLTLKVVDAEVTIPAQGIKKASCSCPSVELCRHRLMAWLWLASLLAPEETATEQQHRNPSQTDNLQGTPVSEIFSPAPEPATWQYTLEQLTRWAGKKTVQAGIDLLHSDPGVVITEAIPILVQFPRLNATCRLFPDADLESIICSCQSRTGCRHQIAAVLAYQQAHGFPLPDTLPAPSPLTATSGAPRNRSEIILAVNRLLEEAIAVGLSHLSDGFRQRCTTLAIATLGVNLPRLSLGLRRIADEIALNLEREATADSGRLLLAIARTYALGHALQSLEQPTSTPSSAPTQIPPSELIGQQRTHYEAVGTLELTGIGAYHWESQSGYAGLTLLFWDQGNRQWYSWSDARPRFRGTGFNPQLRYVQGALWNGISNPAEASRSRFKLFNARKNYQNRLSGSAQSRATILGATDGSALDFGDRHFSQWQSLQTYARSVLRVGLKDYNPLQEMVVIQPTTWEERQFDHVHQVFTWLLLDDQESGIQLQVPFRSVDQQRIQTLETLKPEDLNGVAIAAQLIFSRSDLSLYPISLLYPPDSGRSPVLHLSFSAPPASSSTESPTVTTADGEAMADAEEEPLPTSGQGISPLEQRIEHLVAILQQIAEQGIRSLNPTVQQELKIEAERLKTVGLEAIALPLDHLATHSQNLCTLLLRLRYLCQLCSELGCHP